MSHTVAGVFFSRAESYFQGQTGCWEELFVWFSKEDGERGGGSSVLRVWGRLEGWEALRGCCWGSSAQGGGSRWAGQLQLGLPLPLSSPRLREIRNHLHLKQELEEEPSGGLLSLLCRHTAGSDTVRDKNSGETSLSLLPGPRVLTALFSSSTLCPSLQPSLPDQLTHQISSLPARFCLALQKTSLVSSLGGGMEK